MLEDYESRDVYENNNTNKVDKFNLQDFELEEEQKKETILSMATSKKFIFFLTQSHNIFCAESQTLATINESYSLPDPREKYNFKEYSFNKIWADREGNHCIIRHNNAIYYFNSKLKEAFEIDGLRGKEICAVALDDRNTDDKKTNYFLAVDYDNKIYQCSIEITDGRIQDKIEELTTLVLTDPSLEEEEEAEKKKSKVNDRIYGIKFFHATNQTLEQSADSCYIIAVTKDRLYQFKGPGLQNFKQIFYRYENNPALMNESCKHFPQGNIPFKVEFDISYKNESRSIGEQKSKKMDIFSQFGWRTFSGYCFGEFFHENSDKSSGLPLDLKKFTVIPFQKITDKGKKEVNLSPISVVHTLNHVFILYKDCLTVVSKLTSNIVHTEYFDEDKYEESDLMLFNEFSQDKGAILLSSKNGLKKILLKKENDDIWKDYLDIGDFDKAKTYCPKELQKKINKIDAEKEFKKNMIIAANKYAVSDEKMEIVCLKIIKEGDLLALQNYLQFYKFEVFKEEEGNQIEKEQILPLNLIVTWLIELFLNDPNSTMRDFKDLIKAYKKNLNSNLIYQLLLTYGKMKEYEEYSITLGDYKRVVVHRINQGQENEALEFISETASYLVDKAKDNMPLLIKLGNIFLENSHLFFQSAPKMSFEYLINYMMTVNVDIEKYIENIVSALMSRADKDVNKAKKINELNSEEKKKFHEELNVILKNIIVLKNNSGFHSNVKNQAKEQMNNILNLYILYLSLNPANKNTIIDFLKEYVKIDSNGKKKKIQFQLDYVKTLLKDNKSAYALILALMGKFSEGIDYVLKKEETKEAKEIKENKEDTEEEDFKEKQEQEIAEFIAQNAPDKILKKKLWIQIFRILGERENDKDKNEEKLSQALKIMEKSKVLKIEDVLPYISDSIKIDDFKKQISECISQYENSIDELKQNIKSYNKTSDNIKMDINTIKKKPMEIKYNEFKCEICKELIRNKRIYLFPCGHMFDAECIRKRLLDYENTGLEYLHEDNVKIDQLFYDLGYIPKKVFGEKETEKEEEEKVEETKIGEEAIKKIGGIFTKIKNELNNINIGGGMKKEDLKFIKEQKEKQYLELLSECLNKNCVLCGNFLVDSVQYSLGSKNASDEPTFEL